MSIQNKEKTETLLASEKFSMKYFDYDWGSNDNTEKEEKFDNFKD
jgi:hypothetical protein